MINKAGKTVLSIVMVTVPDREQAFNKLKSKIDQQIKLANKIHPTLGNVEIVEVNTPRFPKGKTIGEKRQEGLDKAQGEYVCWLDDDDDVSPDYIETLLRLAYAGGDVLTFSSLSRFDNFWCVVQMSLDNQTDEQVKPGIVKRRPWHVCPFKRSLLEGIQFPAKNWDEDSVFILEALKRCNRQANTEAIIHEYKRLTESFSENNIKVRNL